MYGMCAVDMEVKFTWILSMIVHLTFSLCTGWWMLIFMTSLKRSFVVLILEMTVILRAF